jgi:ABC-2 type transport system ATP-binding protein
MMRRVAHALCGALVILAVVGGVAAAPAANAAETLTLPGGPTSATDATPVTISADLYLPAATPAPAVLLAHGFGGSKDSVAEEATYLAERGFVVLAYSARGFGDSTGLISVNAPQYEVADASALVDYLATRPEVRSDGTGDPRVGAAGGSYGGALALLLAGYDDRVDAVAADITWNDLQGSLFAQNGGTGTGVYKELWSALFFSVGGSSGGVSPFAPRTSVSVCGRFTPEWCAAYTQAATTGTISAPGAALMRASSPVSVTTRIAVPTLLGGGQSDSLFPLTQVNANAEQIRAANPDVPVKVVWHAGGHDGGTPETGRLRELTAAWFTGYLADGPQPSADFEVSFVQGSAVNSRNAGALSVQTAARYPGLDGESTAQIAILGPPQQVLAPAGGVPAAITTLPGAGGLAGLASQFLGLPLPGQSAGFVSAPLTSELSIVGAPRVTIRVSSDDVLTDVALFVSLRVVGPGERLTLPNGLVAPIRLDRLGPEGAVVEVQLPAIALNVASGDRLAVIVGTTDQGYRMPDGPAVYTVSLGKPTLSVPQVAMIAAASGLPVWAWPLGGAVVLVVLAILVAVIRPRRRTATRPDLVDVPLAVDGLVKRYRGGLTAVGGVAFTVPPGVVLGLLGPNGAGKTTTMRMVMGLIRPTEGDVFVFGERVSAGAPVLARIGCFVEGPGFLPFLSGRTNLRLYWRASGRRGQDPHLDEVLEIAGLGSAIDRRVKTYSQGMRQRLGIAQAMLGLPDLLVLDEPTNGLDPPQIKQMREVMRDYAARGRTVIVSSHLLSEVEQTCSHVVVMHRGLVIAEGRVEEFLEGRTGLRLEDIFLELVGEGHEVISS